MNNHKLWPKEVCLITLGPGWKIFPGTNALAYMSSWLSPVTKLKKKFNNISTRLFLRRPVSGDCRPLAEPFRWADRRFSHNFLAVESRLDARSRFETWNTTVFLHFHWIQIGTTEKMFQWKRINCKQSARWQRLSQLKASAFSSLQKELVSCM